MILANDARLAVKMMGIRAVSWITRIAVAPSCQFQRGGSKGLIELALTINIVRGSDIVCIDDRDQSEI